MPSDVEFLVCSECGEDVEDFMYEKHWEIMHGSDDSYEMSSSQRRLAAKQNKGKSTMKIAGGGNCRRSDHGLGGCFYISAFGPCPCG